MGGKGISRSRTRIATATKSAVSKNVRRERPFASPWSMYRMIHRFRYYPALFLRRWYRNLLYFPASLAIPLVPPTLAPAPGIPLAFLPHEERERERERESVLVRYRCRRDTGVVRIGARGEDKSIHLTLSPSPSPVSSRFRFCISCISGANNLRSPPPSNFPSRSAAQSATSRLKLSEIATLRKDLEARNIN